MKIESLFFRPSLKPSLALPLGARSVGHYFLPPNHHSCIKTVQFVQVLWSVRGTGSMVMEGVERGLRPGQIALYFPGNQHHFFSREESWELRWWTLDGPLAVPMVSALGLVTGRVYDVGPAPVLLFQKLERAIRNVTPHGEARASALAYELLTRVVHHHSQTPMDQTIQSAVDLIHNEWRNPLVGVDAIARRLQFHRSSFSRRFHAALGVSPVVYLSNLRVQNALSQLQATTRPICEIASDCGWSDVNYFSRCIRRATGFSPRDFRRQS